MSSAASHREFHADSANGMAGVRVGARGRRVVWEDMVWMN